MTTDHWHFSVEMVGFEPTCDQLRFLHCIRVSRYISKLSSITCGIIHFPMTIDHWQLTSFVLGVRFEQNISWSKAKRPAVRRSQSNCSIFLSAIQPSPCYLQRLTPQRSGWICESAIIPIAIGRTDEYLFCRETLKPLGYADIFLQNNSAFTL